MNINKKRQEDGRLVPGDGSIFVCFFYLYFYLFIIYFSGRGMSFA